VKLLLNRDNMALVGDVYSVEEFADILLLHQADVVNHGSTLRHLLNIRALDNKFVLDIVRAVADDVACHVHLAHALFTQEVAHLDALLVVRAGDVNWKVSVHKAQLVAETPRDADDQVLQDRAGRVDLRHILPVPMPYVDTQLAILHLADVGMNMPQQAR
jgi:hypothetical protein